MDREKIEQPASPHPRGHRRGPGRARAWSTRRGASPTCTRRSSPASARPTRRELLVGDARRPPSRDGAHQGHRLLLVCEHHLLPFFGHGPRRLHPSEARPYRRPVQARARGAQGRGAAAAAGAHHLARSPTPSRRRSRPAGALVLIEAEHLCMTMRGVRTPGAKTVTSAVRGIIQTQRGHAGRGLRAHQRAALTRAGHVAGRADVLASTCRSRASWASSTSRPTRSPTAAASSPPTPRSSRASRWCARARRSSTSAASPRGPARSRCPRDEELRRVLPVVEALAGSVGVPISVDTIKAEVARRALAAGAALINDVSALRVDPEHGRRRRRGRAARSASCTCRASRGRCRTTRATTTSSTRCCASSRSAWPSRSPRGVREEQIMLDPGIGFGKTVAHNLALLRRLARFAALGGPSCSARRASASSARSSAPSRRRASSAPWRPP